MLQATDRPSSERTETSEKEWVLPPPHTILRDPLLGCLLTIARLMDRPCAPEALLAGLPLVNNRLTPALFVKAARRAGFSAQIVARRLEDVSSLVLPCTLLLKSQQACVLVQKRNAENTALVIQPESGEGQKVICLEELQQEYTGYALFIKPPFRFDRRTEIKAPKPSRAWFWEVVASTWKLYAEVMIASFFINLFAIASSLFTMNVYDRVVPNHAKATLGVLSIGVLIVFCFDFLMRTLRGYFIDVASKKTDVLLSASLFERMLGVPLSERPRSVGSFANHMQQFDTFRDFLTSTTISTLIDLPFVLFFVFIIFLLGGSVAIVPLLAVPFVIVVGIGIQSALHRAVKASYRHSGQKQALLIESLIGIETIKSLGAEGFLQRKWEQAVGMAAKSAIRIKGLSASAVHFSLWVQQVAVVLVVVMGVLRIHLGEMTMGALIACTLLTGRALAPLSQLAGLLMRYHQAIAALQAVDTLMKMPTEQSREPSLRTTSLRGEVTFQEVVFHYPRQSVRVLDGICFHIKEGEKVAIIGRVGSGKTTIEKLVLGLYPPLRGTILLDGTEIHQFDPVMIRRNIGYVPQDIFLFYGSLRENITYTAPFVEESAILKAARVAGIAEWIAQHPQGLDMPVGEQGSNLSGGQRQAIAIARALVLDPPLLLLDEPTSMMDNRTESLVKSQLATAVKDKTVVLVTHKSTLLTLVDRIIVMDEGKIRADGPRDLVLQALSEGKIYAHKR